MPSPHSAATSLTDLLQLETPPVALALVDAPPAGVPVFEAAVPSACTMWRVAERGVSFAPSAVHGNCPVGAFVLGFDTGEAGQEALGAAVGAMTEAGYIGPEEPAALPRLERPRAGVLYGPLAELPLAPDVVLMWLTPAQAMVFHEASGGARWGAEGGHRATRALLGRPTCAAIPAALEDLSPTLSLGCLGMRTFTEVAGDRLMAVVPGAVLDDFVDGLSAAVGANRIMGERYQAQKAAIPPRPGS
jgi:uncharacterized protein (DUF169 family)